MEFIRVIRLTPTCTQMRFGLLDFHVTLEIHPGFAPYLRVSSPGPDQILLNQPSHHVKKPVGKVSFISTCGFCLYKLWLSLSSLEHNSGLLWNPYCPDLNVFRPQINFKTVLQHQSFIGWQEHGETCLTRINLLGNSLKPSLERVL